MSEEEINITLKPSKGDNIPVTVDPSKTVLEIKQSVAEKVGIPAEEQRLIFKGQLLKDDTPLQSYGPSNGVVIHLVRGRSQTAEPSPGSAAPQTPANPPPNPAAAFANNPFAAFNQAPGLQANAGAAGNPLAQQMMAAMAGQPGAGGLGGGAGMFGLDPAMMQQMMANPMMQQMMQQLMSNPQMLQQMMQSPVLQQMMANNPLLQGTPQAMQHAMDPQYLQMLGQLMGGAGGAAGGALPPVAPGLGGFADFGRLAGLGGFGAPATAGPPPPNASELYATQLQQMREMGFPNDEANLAALHSCGGSVTMAVDRLLQAP
jgi:ubiquilin